MVTLEGLDPNLNMNPRETGNPRIDCKPTSEYEAPQRMYADAKVLPYDP